MVITHPVLFLLVGSTTFARAFILDGRNSVASFNQTLACIDSCTAPYGGQHSPEETRDNNCFSIVPDAEFPVDATDPKIPACICNTKDNATSGYATVESCFADQCTAILQYINFDGEDDLAHRVWEQNKGETNITKYLDAVCPGIERSLQQCSTGDGEYVECDDGEGGGPEGSLTVSLSHTLTIQSSTSTTRSSPSTTQSSSSTPQSTPQSTTQSSSAASAMVSATHTTQGAAAIVTVGPHVMLAAGLGVLAAL
ncbi:Hypothetical protein R9X50_00399600 [Acrodontium crateriforme]|uniref:Uncharacterized protein n=1 Tax=Acrodontium crateriforme TaxID=150365 RepID=A0AAQ3R4Q3_9PEZI|nr:Hypothetical protein R9X50_00399600 [Acrodontium crateriforme]